MKFKKVFKWILILTTALIGILIIAAALAVNVVFTPKKITPIVIQAVNRQITGELKAETISLTFFSTFPDISLKVNKATILTPTTEEGVENKMANRDTLASFETAFISLDAMAFLTKRKLNVHTIEIIRPSFNATISPSGEANWNIVKEPGPGDATTEQDSIGTTLDFRIKDLILKNATITYRDQNAALLLLVSGLDANVEVTANTTDLVLNTSLTTPNVNFRQGDETIASNLRLRFSTAINMDKTSRVLSIAKGTAVVNDVDFSVSGKIGPSAKTSVPVDLKLSLNTPSLERLIYLIPESILGHGKKLNTTGDVSLAATLKGIYGMKNVPTISATLLIKDGSIQYPGRSTKIDKINTDVAAYIDLTKRTKSHLTIRKFTLAGRGVSLAVDGVVNDLLDNAQVVGNARGHMDLKSLQNSLPFSTKLAMQGKVDMLLKGQFAHQDIVKHDYGKISLRGKVSFLNTKISYDNDSINFSTPRMQMNFGVAEGKGLQTTQPTSRLGGVIAASAVRTSIKNTGSFSSDSLFIGFGTTPRADRSKPINIRSTLHIKNANIAFGDTAKATAGKLDARVRLRSSAQGANSMALETDFSIDSVIFRSKGFFLGIRDGDYAFKISRNSDSRLAANGHISFDQVYLYSKLFPTLIKIPKTKIVVQPGIIELEKAIFQVGESDIELTGKVHDFGHVLFKKKPLRATLALNSKLVNVNELVSILNKAGSEALSESEVLNGGTTQFTQSPVPPNSALHTFIVPKGVDFTFHSNIQKLIFGHLEMTDMQGDIKVQDQNIRLSKLDMKTMGAEIRTTLRYAAVDSANASVHFNLGLHDVDMKNLSKIIPALDTLLPMTRSFEGNVDFVLNGTSKLNSQMGIELSSLRAIGRVKGENLVIMDSETFSQVSKTLMFKNKERNVVDSASFEMLIANNTMEILPSMVSIDRYQVAIGGTHKIDMTYAYHVSVLKSPMPFKAGIELLGDLNDYKIKVSSAKYKHLFSDKKRHQEKADSTIIRKKQAILKRISL